MFLCLDYPQVQIIPVSFWQMHGLYPMAHVPMYTMYTGCWSVWGSAPWAGLE